MKQTLILTLALLCAMAQGAKAQETLTVYDGTATNEYVPMYVYYFDDFTRSQFVVPAADLTAMKGGEITAITYYTTRTSEYETTSEVDVYLKEVGSTSLSAFEDKATATIVYHGKLNFVVVGDKCQVTITFTTPFGYDGGNLLIGLDNTTDKGYARVYFYGQTVSGAAVYGYNGSNLASVTPTTQGFIPKTTFTYEAAKACAKPTNLAFTGITTQSATVTWQGGGTRWNLQYKAADAENWKEVNGLTTPSYALTGLAEGATYHVRVQTDCGDDTSYWTRASFTTINPVISIGSGTSTNAYVPFSFSNAYSFSQQIYTVEELGATPCAITSIDFYETSRDASSGAVDIYMTETDKMKFSDQYDWVEVQDYTLVYSGDVTFTKDSWTTITFDTPYYYDGTKNVLLMVHDRRGTTGNTVSFRVCSSSYGQALCACRYNGTDFDLSDLSSIQGSYTDYKNQIRLKVAGYPACQKPTSVSVGSIAPYSATVTWEGSGSKWNLRYKLASAEEWTTVNGLTAKTRALTSLTQDATYYVGVQTDCGGGEQSPWKYITFKTAEAVPTPSGLECTSFTASSATITWTENGEATAWQVCLNNDETALIAANSNPFTVTGLTEDVIYSIKVRATNGGMNSKWSDAVSVQPTDKICLGTVSGVMAESSSHTSLPYNSYNNYTLSQQIYTTDELGTTPCSFTSVDFRLKGTTALKRHLDIYMVLTDKGGFSSSGSYSQSKDWAAFTADDRVFSGEVQTVKNAWTSIAFDVPFMYDGQHNVVLVVHDKTGSSHSGLSWATYATTDKQALYNTDSYEMDLTDLSDRYGYAVNMKNLIRLGKEAYNTCQKPTAITVSNVTATGAVISWTSEAAAWDVMLDGTVVATAITTKSYALTGLEMASVHEVQVRTNCGGGSVSPWSNAVSFNTILCNDVDKCLISYELSISSEYYEEWFGCAIQVIDVLTGELLDSWTITEGGTASGTLAVCNGRQIQFKWKDGGASERCIYSVYDNNGDLILSGKEKLRTPVTYTIDCTSYLRKPVDLACTRSVAPKATLTWTEKGTATKWEICLDGDETNLRRTTANPFTLTGLTGETTHTAKVRAVDGDEISKWSDEISFEVTTTTPIGTGTSTDNNLPLNNWYSYSLSEQIYTAAELGDEATSIETIEFYNTYTNVQRSLDIYMVATDKDQFANNKDWVTVTTGDLVFSGTVTFANNAWTTITLDTPFEYDGKTNMLLVVDDNTGSSGSSAYFYSFEDAKYRSLYYRNSSTNLNPTLSLSDVSNGGMARTKNQIRLLMNEPAAVPKPAAFRSTWAYSHSAWLRWEEKGKASDWQICVNDDEDNLITVTQTPYLMEGLSPETEYTVKVRSVYNGQYSRWAGPITFTTSANEEPQDFEAGQIGPNSAVLSWYGDDIVTAWQICVNGDEANLIDVNYSQLSMLNAQCSYILTGLTPETEYTLKVRGVIPGETCPWSDKLVFTTTEVNPVPRDIEIAAAHTTANVKWLGFSDRYNVQYRTMPGITNPVYSEDFEGDSMEGTLVDCDEYTGVVEEDMVAHTGNRGFLFGYTYNPPQYLISPELTGVTEGMKLQFYYKNYSSTYEETFQVGFSTTTNETSAFDFGDEMTASDAQWHLYNGSIPAGTKYICLKHTSYDQYFLFIDDIVVGAESAAGDWQTVNTDEATATITGLTAHTEYEVQVQGIVGEAVSAWSPSATFTTQSASTKIFFADGNWNDASNWEPAGAPSATDDVYIMAAATIPSGVVATARNITISGMENTGGGGWAAARATAPQNTRAASTPSITLKDGGQLRHSTEELYVTVEKNISGYGTSATGGYRLLANPLSEQRFGTYPDEAGMTNGSYDIYDFNNNEELEWRNYKSGAFDLYANNESACLYANSSDQTLTFTGLTGPSDGEYASSVVVDGDVRSFTNGWRIFANTSVSNAYVEYGMLDNDWVLTPVDCNFYKMNTDGDSFTRYKNYVELAPGEAVFVEASASGSIHWKYEPIYNEAPVAEAGTFHQPYLPKHGLAKHQDAHLKGDVNSDGKVTPADAIMILYHYFNVQQNGFILEAADLNGDGNITPADAIETLYKYFGASGNSNNGARATSPTTDNGPDPE
ncbi:MAG: fibronectin type III domain-containing protein [Prevotella sp.]|nr:fibronectin type III domain-containing protein [Prevotella sp.]